jgi:hypothetical protein
LRVWMLRGGIGRRWFHPWEAASLRRIGPEGSPRTGPVSGGLVSHPVRGGPWFGWPLSLYGGRPQ